MGRASRIQTSCVWLKTVSWFQHLHFPVLPMQTLQTTSSTLLPEALPHPPHRNQLTSFLMLTPYVTRQVSGGRQRALIWGSEKNLMRASSAEAGRVIREASMGVEAPGTSHVGNHAPPAEKGREEQCDRSWGESCRRGGPSAVAQDTACIRSRERGREDWRCTQPRTRGPGGLGVQP